MKKFLWVLLGLIVLAAIGNMMNGTTPGGSRDRPLTAEQLAAVAKAHEPHAWFEPKHIEVSSNGFVVADYEVPDGFLIAKQRFAEERLIAIREALLPFGFENYRVNVNGPSPGTGLVRRYGSARFIAAGGRVEWLAP